MEDYKAMKIKYVLGCFVLLLALAANASAQLIAGTPEDRLYQEITAAADLDQKIELCLQFESEFPDSDVLVDIYTMLMDVHSQRNESAQVIEYGEKAIAQDGENVTALMTVARSLAVARQQLPKAVEYAERAVNTIEQMKVGDVPQQFTPATWDQYIASLEAPARDILSYARTVSP